MKKTRNINLDLIRVFSMLCVIGVHTSPKPLAENAVFIAIFTSILLTCNGNFYMLSGQLNLRGSFDSKTEYRNYYAKKFISIVVPFFLMTCILTVCDLLTNKESITFWVLVKKIYSAFMADNVSTHLWFIYPLIGMLLAAPFLAKLFNAMSDWELHLLFILAMCWNVVGIYFTVDFGVGFSYTGWLLNQWLIAFFAGYYVNRTIHEKNKGKWYLAGVLCFILNTLGIILIPEHYSNSTDLAPAYVIFNIAFYAFLKNNIKIKNEVLITVIQFLAKHSFSVYLIHWIISRQITPLLVNTAHASINYCISVMVTFGISLVLAVAFDTIISFPLQKALRKIMLS